MKRFLLPLLLLALPTGCGGWRNPVAALDPHRVEVQQGNLVTQEMVARLKPGMSPSQVRFVLGTPLIVDPFHKDRWDYAYLLKQKGDVIEQRHITILFENDKLKAIEGDVKPAAAQTTPQPVEAAKP